MPFTVLPLQTDAASTNGPKSDEVTKADRRNETFPEPEYGPVEKQEYDVSNDTFEETDEEPIHTVENTDQRDQLKDREASAEKQDKPPVQGDQSKNVTSETDILTDDANTNTLKQQDKTRENGTENEPSHLSTESLSEELKSLDANSTSDDDDREIVNVAPKSDATDSEKSVTAAENDTEDNTVEKEEKTEISGSGEDSLDDIKGNNDATATDDKLSQEGSGSGQAPNKAIPDGEINGSVQSMDHNENKGLDERESQSLTKETMKQSSFSESKAGSEESFDQPAVVNVTGNQIMGNQSEEEFHPDSTERIGPKNESAVLEENERTSQTVITNNTGNTVFTVEGPVKSATTDDENPRENLDEPEATQPVFNESERAISDTKLEEGLQTQNDQPNSNLDVTKAQPNKPDQPALNEIDNASGAGGFTQESLEETEGTQDQNSQTDLEPPAVLDDFAGSSSSSTSNPLVVNVEGSQESDYNEDASQDAIPEDTSDEIPVYTLSSPVGDDSLAADEGTLSPMPTSSVPTASANFIDAGANMSPGYSESSPFSEGYGTFTAADAPSQEVFNSFTPSGKLLWRFTTPVDDMVIQSLSVVMLRSQNSWSQGVILWVTVIKRTIVVDWLTFLFMTSAC